MIRKLLHTPWPALGWTAMIFILLTVNTGHVETGPLFEIPQLDKVIHAFLFGMLVYLWWKYISTRGRNKLKAIFLLALLASAYGAGMEFYQKYFTSREFEWGDIAADTVGAILVFLFYAGRKNKPL